MSRTLNRYQTQADSSITDGILDSIEDRDTIDFLSDARSQLRATLKSHYEPNKLNTQKEFTAICLRQMKNLTHGNKHTVRVKARIPELHTLLPIPTARDDWDHLSIYPTFLGAANDFNPKITNNSILPGTRMTVTFENMGNFSGPSIVRVFGIASAEELASEAARRAAENARLAEGWNNIYDEFGGGGDSWTQSGIRGNRVARHKGYGLNIMKAFLENLGAASISYEWGSDTKQLMTMQPGTISDTKPLGEPKFRGYREAAGFGKHSNTVPGQFPTNNTSAFNMRQNLPANSGVWYFEDISGKCGGPLAGHNSHQTGIDVDLSFPICFKKGSSSGTSGNEMFGGGIGPGWNEPEAKRFNVQNIAYKEGGAGSWRFVTQGSRKKDISKYIQWRQCAEFLAWCAKSGLVHGAYWHKTYIRELKRMVEKAKPWEIPMGLRTPVSSTHTQGHNEFLGNEEIWGNDPVIFNKIFGGTDASGKNWQYIRMLRHVDGHENHFHIRLAAKNVPHDAGAALQGKGKTASGGPIFAGC